MHQHKHRPWPLEIAFAGALILVFWLPRLFIVHKVGFDPSVFSGGTLLRLLIFDLTVVGYFLLPLLIVGLIWPSRRPRPRWTGALLSGYLAFAFFLTLMTCFCEYFFIDEFSSRYNFIAVDYLVYTSEVLQNIWESYSVLPLILMVVTASVALTWWLRRFTFRLAKSTKVVLMIGFTLLFVFVNETAQLTSLNENQREFSKNSFHALFAAFRNNQIDFDRFYSTLPHDTARELVSHELRKDFSDNEVGQGSVENQNILVSNLKRNDAPKKFNLVLVLMESMSAKYLRAYGGEGLTANLDHLHEVGLTFDHTYATGTRTVRGLEAILLSLPPTPGQSILRRPHSDNLFTLGSVLKDNGYDLSFIYGGHAFFDNMREFFETNGFNVLDQGEFARDEVHFSNAWGICDEDVFDFSIKHADALSATGTPFFQLILTTSNHRPYTFPDGRIDRESGSSRESAVKYSDFAIGHFLQAAQKKPWFDNTIFVFIADHDAAVAGGTKILPSDYRIPFIVYAPKILEPQKISKIASQIDVAPTLLGLLGISYQSRFYGHDLRHAQNERALLGTYQKLAYMEKDRMMILSPPKKWELYHLDGEKPTLLRSGSGTDGIDDFIRTGISYYQSASDSFRSRAIGLENRFPASLNMRLFRE